MKLIVCSRAKAGRFTWSEKYAVISIGDPTDESTQLLDHPERVGVLRLFFNDADRPRPGQVLISDENAIQIATFVKNLVGLWSEDIVVMVHCVGGVSRSAGCAAALAKFFNQDDTEFFNSPLYIPNILVYSKVICALQNTYGQCFFHNEQS